MIYEILQAKKVILESVDSHSGAVGADITTVVAVGGPPLGANLSMSATKKTLVEYTVPDNKVRPSGSGLFMPGMIPQLNFSHLGMLKKRLLPSVIPQVNFSHLRMLKKRVFYPLYGVNTRVRTLIHDWIWEGCF